MKTILFILMLCLGHTVSGQSFFAKKYTLGDTYSGEQRQKTLGQRIRNKIKYARKRQDNQWFSERERKRDMKRRGFRA
jgi:hypothetical protein